MKKNMLFLSFLLLIFICGIFYPITKLLSKNKAKDLQTLTIEKAESAIKMLMPYFNKSIENSDDINLIANVKTAMKIENIMSCFILDQNVKVVIYNNTSEWNTEKDTEIYNKAVKQKNRTFAAHP